MTGSISTSLTTSSASTEPCPAIALPATERPAVLSSSQASPTGKHRPQQRRRDSGQGTPAKRPAHADSQPGKREIRHSIAIRHQRAIHHLLASPAQPRRAQSANTSPAKTTSPARSEAFFLQGHSHQRDSHEDQEPHSLQSLQRSINDCSDDCIASALEARFL